MVQRQGMPGHANRSTSEMKYNKLFFEKELLILFWYNNLIRLRIF